MRSTRIRRPAHVAAVLFAAAVVAWPAAARQADIARVYVTVLDSQGRPIRGLKPADFTVLENGVPKTVVGVEEAAAPLSVELITDRLGGVPSYGPTELRDAVGAIVHLILGVLPQSKIGLLTFDGASIEQVKFTSSGVQLDNAIRTFFSNNSPPVLLEAISDACHNFDREKVPTERRDVVAVVADYKADMSAVLPQFAAQDLQRAKAALWVLEAENGTGSAPSTGRDAVVLDVAPKSGGASLSVSTGTALKDAATRLAYLMLAQYSVAYQAPGESTGTSLNVSVAYAGAKVIAPHWN